MALNLMRCINDDKHFVFFDAFGNHTVLCCGCAICVTDGIISCVVVILQRALENGGVEREIREFVGSS